MPKRKLSSKGQRFVASAIAAASRNGKKSAATRARRRSTYRTLARFIEEHEHQQISSIDELSFETIRRFIDYRLKGQ